MCILESKKVYYHHYDNQSAKNLWYHAEYLNLILLLKSFPSWRFLDTLFVILKSHIKVNVQFSVSRGR